MTALEMKKYLPYCSFSRFKYSDLVYEEGERIGELFIVLEGEVEVSCERESKLEMQQAGSVSSGNLYRMVRECRERKEIKVVRMGRAEVFGL